MPKIRKEMAFPLNSVVRQIPRTRLPHPFCRTPGYGEQFHYVEVDTYNLVIVPSGDVRVRTDPTDTLDYCYLWSGKSGKVYQWGDYYTGEYYRKSSPVGGEMVLVECVPYRKDYTKPPLAVNVYASTAGVVWLALRCFAWVLTNCPTTLTEIEDAPFGMYLDRLEEIDLESSVRGMLADRINEFFGVPQ